METNTNNNSVNALDVLVEEALKFIKEKEKTKKLKIGEKIFYR